MPLSHMIADLENPISRLFFGRIPSLRAVKRRSGVRFELLISPRMKAKSQLPNILRKRFWNGSEKFLSMERPLTGLALVEKTVLPIQPGPHQFFLEPNVIE